MNLPSLSAEYLSTLTSGQLERVATLLLGDDTSITQQERTADARQAKRERTLCRVDRAGHALRPSVSWLNGGFDWYAAQRILVNAGSLAEAALAPAPARTRSRAERREVTRLIDKTAVHAPKMGKREQVWAIKLQRERIRLIAEGTDTLVRYGDRIRPYAPLSAPDTRPLVTCEVRPCPYLVTTW